MRQGTGGDFGSAIGRGIIMRTLTYESINIESDGLVPFGDALSVLFRWL
jgi:hypothetical protein